MVKTDRMGIVEGAARAAAIVAGCMVGTGIVYLLAWVAG